jgi:3-hydroxyisobutyrate dehydrogenase
MLPEGSHVRIVYLDSSSGILGIDLAARVLVDCSTIDTETCLHVAAEVRNLHPSVSFYDAPVSGGTLGAESGSLTIMLGCSDDGSDAQYPLVYGLLSLMGNNVVPCGGLGMGLTAKLCNNYCSGLIALATAEAMNIGIRSGMNPKLLSRVFANSTAQSTICDKWNPVPGVCPDAPASKGYKGGFKVQLMAKDFGLAVSEAEKVDARLLLGNAGLEAYRSASQDPNCRDLDSRVLFRFIGGNEDWAHK